MRRKKCLPVSADGRIFAPSYDTHHYHTLHKPRHHTADDVGGSLQSPLQSVLCWCCIGVVLVL